MDHALKEAATNGDINFLMNAISQHPHSDDDYFLTHLARVEENDDCGNIFHIAAWNDQTEFIKEAIERLPNAILNQLLFAKDVDHWTPLHAASRKGKNCHGMIKLILDYYKSMPSDVVGKLPKPWLALAVNNETPLHVLLEGAKNEDEDSAMELLLMDVELLCNTVSYDGMSPLFLAIRNGYSEVAETMLTALPSSSIPFSSSDGLTPLHFAPNCSETVFKLVLKNFGECIDTIDNKGYSVLHQWAKIGKAWSCKLILESSEFIEARTKIFKDLLILKENENGDTPLHISARNKASELSQILVRGYQQVISENQGVVSDLECPPWKVENNSGDIPLITAMYPTARHELALDILTIDPTICQFMNNKGESLFFAAVMAGCESVVEKILSIEQPRYNKLRRNDGTTVLHFLHLWPEITGRRLFGKYWWMMNLADDKKITPLDTAKENNALWLVNLLMNPSLIHKEPFDWITACEREETSAIFAFIDNCYDLQRLCQEQNDTPLHHIKFPTYKDYQNFLKLPSIIELKNTTDHDGSTPLYRALERKDKLLSKILLLDNGVDRTILNNKGTTAMNLLAHLYKEKDDWKKMCKEIKVNPFMKTTYIQHGTNLEQIRTTLSVVAALLATITFAAGFTLPGGIKSDTGDALLAKKAAFLVFLLADVFAMCTSVLVLFFLIWSIVSEPDLARVLVDRSVYILVLSLYGTLLAFMSGIYTVISHGSLWATILVIVMCSLIAISASLTILYKVFAKSIAKLIPTSRTRTKDPLCLLEEDGVAESSTEKDASS